MICTQVPKFGLSQKQANHTMSGSRPAPSPQQQEAYLSQMRQQMQVQFMQDLIHKVTDQCYKKCTSTSGSGLSGREKDCMANCMDRYMETMNVVNETLSSRQGMR